MAIVQNLTVEGAAVFPAPNGPASPVRVQDMPMLAALPALNVSGGTINGTGSIGQYYSDGKVFWFCYAANKWAWSFLVNNALPPSP